jgi:hypothetical protein
VTAHLITTLAALLGVGVVYGTDVFGALVLVPAARRARASSVADLMGWIHELADRRMPFAGVVGVAGALMSAWLADSSLPRLLASIAGGAQLVWIGIYASVSAPINKQLRVAARAGETPPTTGVLQARWGAVIWPRAALQSVAFAALLGVLLLSR